MDAYAINSWLLETRATASLVPLPSATINKSENILIETELYNLRLLITFYLYIITYYSRNCSARMHYNGLSSYIRPQTFCWCKNILGLQRICYQMQ